MNEPVQVYASVFLSVCLPVRLCMYSLYTCRYRLCSRIARSVKHVLNYHPLRDAVIMPALRDALPCVPYYDLFPLRCPIDTVFPHHRITPSPLHHRFRPATVTCMFLVTKSGLWTFCTGCSKDSFRTNCTRDVIFHFRVVLHFNRTGVRAGFTRCISDFTTGNNVLGILKYVSDLKY